MEILKLDTTDSTNTWVTTHEQELSSPSLVYAVEQRAGRGQRGNSWESEAGKNITASMLFHPYNFEASRQFEISEAVALALTEFLNTAGIEAKIKWPNDIYVGDRKICGILVEHAVTGKNITRTIIGIGLNLNQTEFHSDAPNPVSLAQLTGKQYDLKTAVDAVAFYLERYLDLLENGECLHNDFMKRLWRHDGKKHMFLDKKTGEKISAVIHTIEPDGRLCLLTASGLENRYYFKEVEFLLDER